MTTPTAIEPEPIAVIGGVDTHKNTHYAAAIDDHGRLLGHHEFPANDRGYADLLKWVRSHGDIAAIGVESTGSFGAALTRYLTAHAVRVVEVNRPNRLARHMDGKSDRLDAEQIARAVLGHTSTATPKAKSGIVEVIRTLRVTRTSAVKARTNAFNTLWGVMIGAPSPLRDELVVLSKKTLVNRCLRLRPEAEDLLSLATDLDKLLMAGVKTALRDLARRWKQLDDEVKTLNKQIEALVRAGCACFGRRASVRNRHFLRNLLLATAALGVSMGPPVDTATRGATLVMATASMVAFFAVMSNRSERGRL